MRARVDNLASSTDKLENKVLHFNANFTNKEKPRQVNDEIIESVMEM